MESEEITKNAAQAAAAEAQKEDRPVYVKEILSFRFMVWAFFLMGVIGVLIEGVFCVFFYGHWETHVTSVFLWHNALYGVGAVLFFGMAAKLDRMNIVLKSVIMMLAATILELLAGFLILYGLGMRAWNYFDTPYHFMGLIAPRYALGWGVIAFAVCLIYRPVGTAAAKLKSKVWKGIAVGLFVIMGTDAVLASMCMARWSQRHYGGHSGRPTAIDRLASDEWMKEWFIEWKFDDECDYEEMAKGK